MTNDDNQVDFPVEVETIEMAESTLQDAKAALEDKNSRINALEETNAELSDLSDHADAFAQIASAHGYDPQTVDVGEVVDEHTKEVRSEVAELEMALAAYDTEDIEARAEDLCGKSPQYLEARAGELARKKLNTDNEQKAGSKATVANHETARAGQAGTGGMTEDERVEEIADGVLGFEEAARARDSGMSPSQYVMAEYGVEASEFSNEQALMQEVRRVRQSGGTD